MYHWCMHWMQLPIIKNDGLMSELLNHTLWVAIHSFSRIIMSICQDQTQRLIYSIPLNC